MHNKSKHNLTYRNQVFTIHSYTHIHSDGKRLDQAIYPTEPVFIYILYAICKSVSLTQYFQTIHSYLIFFRMCSTVA